jgi:hypothetical protein
MPISTERLIMPWNVHSPAALVVATTDPSTGVEEVTTWDPKTREFSGTRAAYAREAAEAGTTVELARGWTEQAGSGDELSALAAIVEGLGGDYELRDATDALVLRVLAGAACAEMLDRSDLLWAVDDADV